MPKIPALCRCMFCIATVSILVVSSLEAQTIYKYTDKDGAVVLTDKPPAGVKAEPFVSAAPAAKAPSVDREGPAIQTLPSGSTTAEEAIRQRDEQFGKVIKAVETRERDRELERQRRFQEADRMEAEARQPMPSTRENRQRQYELLQEAEKLRRAE